MSINVDHEDIQQDRLSALLRRIDFSARVFFREGYCGEWAVDTSGSTHAPFHLVSYGEGWVHTDNAAPRRLVAGQLAFFPHDTRHVLSASDVPPALDCINQAPPERLSGEITRLVCGYFTFDQKAAAPLLASLPSTVVLDLSESSDAATRDLVSLWMREAAGQSLGADLAVDLFAELVFVHMLRSEINSGRLRGVIGALGDPRLGAVIARVHAEPGAAHSLTAMAEQAGMSESALTQRFRKQIGMTPGQYVKHWRMLAAARLLTDSQASVLEISEAVGYQTEVAFRKAFSAHFQIAPGRFRREAASRKAGGK